MFSSVPRQITLNGLECRFILVYVSTFQKTVVIEKMCFWACEPLSYNFHSKFNVTKNIQFNHALIFQNSF